MSLGRLLTAGRSLVGGSNSEPHYRMSDPKAMPKFGSAKNPFRSKPQRPAPTAETSRAVVASAAAPAPASSAGEAGRGTHAASTPALSPADGLRGAEVPVAVKRPEGRAPAAPETTPAPAAPKRARFQFGWLRQRSARLFSWLSRSRPAAAKAAVPRFDALPIQGELALDRIKVVRNDLSDADLEIVTRAPATPKPGSASPAVKTQPELVPLTAPAAAPVQKPGAARTAWNRAGRLLGAMKT